VKRIYLKSENYDSIIVSHSVHGGGNLRSMNDRITIIYNPHYNKMQLYIDKTEENKT